MDPETLEAAAIEVTGGLDDFGDPSYRAGLCTLAAALDAEAQLSPVGVAALEAQITGALANRLRVADWRRAHPEVTTEVVAAPLFVLGMPRTGTTLLAELLACDPARRTLRRWEANDCVPPPEAETFDADPRIASTRASMALMDTLNPGFKAIHFEAADGPTEDVTLLAQHFTSLLWETVANVPSYGEWLLAQDERAAYRYHHDVLQVLQSRAPGPWTLKSPHHGLALDALFGEYPDARVVITHRDPSVVVASVCSLVRSLSGTFSDADHRAYIVRRWPTVIETILTRIAEYRGAHADAPILDVDYDTLVADPIACVRAIYAWERRALSAGAEDAMRAYLVDNPPGKHGTHTYSLEELGVREDELRDRFAALA